MSNNIVTQMEEFLVGECLEFIWASDAKGVSGRGEVALKKLSFPALYVVKQKPVIIEGGYLVS